MVAAAFRVGVRVPDQPAASTFYRGLGFTDVGSIPGPNGDPVMTIMERGGAHLLVEALVGMPFPDSAWERATQQGPRGLGVTLGVAFDDRPAFDRALTHARTAGATVNSEPEEQPWGDVVAEAVDPWGYIWELSTPTEPDDTARPDQARSGMVATSQAWFGGNGASARTGDAP